MSKVETRSPQVLNVTRDTALRSQLLTRRERLKASISELQNTDEIVSLLREVDAALERMEKGTFGICETCHGTIENDRLLVDPLSRNCLDHLSEKERKAMEKDLDLAYEVQRGLLPRRDFVVDGWKVCYHYDPAGSVSGDYCDIITPDSDPGSMYFLVGDVTGKGVAASLLMSHLHATFRSLVSARLAVHELVRRANRIFCEGTLSTHFATLVCGKAETTGEVQICNAGHCPPLHIRKDGVRMLPSTGLPIGVVRDSSYTSVRLSLSRDESLVLYTDGLSEAMDIGGGQYGDERLATLAREQGDLGPELLIKSYLDDLRVFRRNAQRTDDLTLMVVRRSG